MEVARGSGILLHPTSLPGAWGVGDLGPAAYRFVDWLGAAGQGWWQVLPLGPTGYENSPYMCFSAFAGNPLLISPEGLVEDHLLGRRDLDPPPPSPPGRAHYPGAIEAKQPMLWKAFERFRSRGSAAHRRAFLAFREANRAWLEEYALFMALKEAHGGRPWTGWEADLSAREPSALLAAGRRLRRRVEFHRFLQYLFFRQWAALRSYCRQRRVGLIGDLPIYLAHDSAEVWSRPEMFSLDARGQPTVVSGVPPDYFSATGQRWGNPIYRWEREAQSGYRWWVDRFRAGLALVDLLRLDHFRGFEAYWEIPAGARHATRGRWVRGPGADLFDALGRALGPLPLIAEDLGVITPEVEALRDRFHLPGMRVLQMAFGRDPKAPEYRPHRHIVKCVVYTATHDHNTTVGWFTADPGTQSTQSPQEVKEERAFALRYLGTDGREIHWDLIRLALSSVAHLALLPLQDVLGLGSEARMNRPGRAGGNWEWRYAPARLTDRIGERLRDLTALYDRRPGTPG